MIELTRLETFVVSGGNDIDYPGKCFCKVKTGNVFGSVELMDWEQGNLNHKLCSSLCCNLGGLSSGYKYVYSKVQYDINTEPFKVIELPLELEAWC